MLLANSPARFSHHDLPRLLAFPPDVVDALISSGAIRTDVVDGVASVKAGDVEEFLRDALLRLYRAEAMSGEVEVTIGGTAKQETAPPPVDTQESDEANSLITRSISEYQAAQQSGHQTDLRIAPRYKPRRQLGGSFRNVRFSILQISSTGIRVRHQDTLRPGDEANLTFSTGRPARSFVIPARVVWTSIGQRGDSPSFCISGLRVSGESDALREAVRLLLDAREVELEAAPVRRASTTGALTGLTDEEVASIIRAVKALSGDPVAAMRWYTRARFAVADEEVRKAAPARARDREEVLAVWEYLGRKLDIKAVGGVVSWIRQTRSASAEALGSL